MKAAIYEGLRDIALEQVPDPKIEQPTDAVVRIDVSAVCGSDLWTYRGQGAAVGTRIGHEFAGEVLSVGAEVQNVNVGDWVIVPFRFSCGHCRYCRRGLQSSCINGGFWGRDTADAGQGEAARIPDADGTLVRALPDGARPDSRLEPSLLALSDVFSTGYHAAYSAHISPGDTVVVVGDGAVGLSAIQSARLLGAGCVINAGSAHADRNALAHDCGADHIVTTRGESAIEAIRSLTHGLMADVVLECVGSQASFATALDCAGPGGTVSYVGLPHGVAINPAALFSRNISLTGGICPARHYIERLLPLVLDEKIQAGLVFNNSYPLSSIAQAYEDMDRRLTVKALIR
jgi:alcohol dehydrogenase